MRIVFRAALACAFVAACGGRSLSYGDGDDDDAGDDSGVSGSSPGGSAGNSSSGGSARGGTSGTTSAGGSDRGGSASGGAASGGSPSAGGAASGGSPSSGGSAGVVDANCYPGLAVSGAECTANCSIPCGFADLGTRTCTCTAGYFSSCHCPRPPEYEGGPTAPPCGTPDGRALPLRNTACDVEWAQCVGNDPVEGSIPRGCACLENPLAGGRLQWFCGSTNRWFFPE